MDSKEALEILYKNCPMVVTRESDGVQLYSEYLIEVIKQDLDRLGQLEDIEEEIGIDLITLFKALKNGIYYKNVETYYCSNIIRVGKYLVEVKPIYAVKETSLESCYYKTDTEQLKYVNDAHYWDWKTCKKWNIKDYGKTWWLKEDLKSEWQRSINRNGKINIKIQ